VFCSVSEGIGGERGVLGLRISVFDCDCGCDCGVRLPVARLSDKPEDFGILEAGAWRRDNAMSLCRTVCRNWRGYESRF
jgi:hypothetical protein